MTVYIRMYIGTSTLTSLLIPDIYQSILRDVHRALVFRGEGREQNTDLGGPTQVTWQKCRCQSGNHEGNGCKSNIAYHFLGAKP